MDLTLSKKKIGSRVTLTTTVPLGGTLGVEIVTVGIVIEQSFGSQIGIAVWPLKK